MFGNTYQIGSKRWRRLLGVVLVAALVVVAGCSGGGGGGSNGAESGNQSGGFDGGGGDGGGGAGAADRGGGEADASGGTGVSDGGGSDDPMTDDGGGDDSFGSHYDSQGNRVVIRSAEMRVEVKNFEKAFRKTRTVVRENGGYVGDREQSGEGEYDQGYFVVHVPARNFTAVRDAIENLGNVRDESVSVLDFTGKYRSKQSRLSELKADERRLERALANASGNADEIRRELQEVREKRRKAQSEANDIRQRASMSTIRVELREPATNRPPRNHQTLAGFVDAFREAFYGGMAAIRFLMVLLGYAIPLGIASAVTLAGGLGAWRGTRRLVTRLGIDRTGGEDDGSPGDDWRRPDRGARERTGEPSDPRRDHDSRDGGDRRDDGDPNGEGGESR